MCCPLSFGLLLWPSRALGRPSADIWGAPGDRLETDYETEKTACSPTISFRLGDWSGCSELKMGASKKEGTLLGSSEALYTLKDRQMREEKYGEGCV